MMDAFVGVDIGGTKCAAVLVSRTGAVLARAWLEHASTAADGPDDIVVQGIDELLGQAGVGHERVASYGVAVAGLVSDDRSTVVRAPTLGARGLRLGDHLAERLGRPVVVLNDANAALYGHVQLGSADPLAADGANADTLLLMLGTGVGGAILADGAIVTGAHGFAAELGHVLVDATDPRTCLCGASGCVEQYASGRGIAELAALDPPPAASRASLSARGAAAPYSARDVVAAAEDGDAWALGLLERAGLMLGRAIAVLCVTLDPGVVIVGGGFGHAAGAWLVPAATQELRARWPYAAERSVPPVRRDILGPYAAATGAALMARHDLDGRS